MTDAAFDDWVERARQVGTLAFAMRRRFAPKGGKALGRGEVAGPCPRCGGVDRFAITADGLWHCRGAGRGGADAISLARYLLGDCSFVEAVEAVTGEPRPGRAPETPEQQAERAAQAARRAEALALEQAQAERQQNSYRERERRRCAEIWRHGMAAPGSMVEHYLRTRAIPRVPPGAKLRFHPQMHLYHPPGRDGTIVWTGPAMLAAIAGNDGRFAGLHTTWLDPALEQGPLVPLPSGKGKLVHVVDGAALEVKRVRGSKSGGRLVVAPALTEAPRRIVIGEGIETVLSVWATLAEIGEDLSETAFWSSIDLGNLGGKALATVPHPEAMQMDAAGRVRRAKVPGPEPDRSDPDRSIAMPESVRDILILADGDSDRFLVECTAARAAARWQAPGREIRVAWPEPGGDFNDMRLRRAGLA